MRGLERICGFFVGGRALRSCLLRLKLAKEFVRTTHGPGPNWEFEALMKILPSNVAEALRNHPQGGHLIEAVLDVGRTPEAFFPNSNEELTDTLLSYEDIENAASGLNFGSNNRAGINGTLHRISCSRNRQGEVIGLRFRVGRAIQGPANIVQDILRDKKSVLFLSPPGMGKTTIVRDAARLLATELNQRVVIVDKTNEIGGDGDIPHPFLGRARRLQVPPRRTQSDILVEALQNHTPQVIVLDEIHGYWEADVCKTIGEGGIQLVATAHGTTIENAIENPNLAFLLGDIAPALLGDAEAKLRAKEDQEHPSKWIRERRCPPTFDVLVEIRDRFNWVIHSVAHSIDAILAGGAPTVEERSMDGKIVTVQKEPTLSQEEVDLQRFESFFSDKKQPAETLKALDDGPTQRIEATVERPKANTVVKELFPGGDKGTMVRPVLEKLVEKKVKELHLGPGLVDQDKVKEVSREVFHAMLTDVQGVLSNAGNLISSPVQQSPPALPCPDLVRSIESWMGAVFRLTTIQRILAHQVAVRAAANVESRIDAILSRGGDAFLKKETPIQHTVTRLQSSKEVNSKADLKQAVATVVVNMVMEKKLSFNSLTMQGLVGGALGDAMSGSKSVLANPQTIGKGKRPPPSSAQNHEKLINEFEKLLKEGLAASAVKPPSHSVLLEAKQLACNCRSTIGQLIARAVKQNMHE